MEENVRPDEAARALTEIGQRQEQVIRLSIIPTWYWWAIAALMVVFAAAIDSQRDVLIGVGTAVFVVGICAATGTVVVGGLRRVQLRNDLIGPVGVLAILGFVAVVVGVSLPIAFGLKAAGVPYAATQGVIAGALLLVTGGPLLMRLLWRIMLANRAGSQR